MIVRNWLLGIALLTATSAAAQPISPGLAQRMVDSVRIEVPPPMNPILERILKYADIEAGHRLCGLASYYSTFFDGRKTANGEIYRNRRYSAAHLTLPLGCWVEVSSRATGKRLRLRVNDRGPYVKKFVLDLSQAAARYLGVDKHPDRHVDIRIIALPGEKPLPENWEEEWEKATTVAATGAM